MLFTDRSFIYAIKPPLVAKGMNAVLIGPEIYNRNYRTQYVIKFYLHSNIR